MFVIIMERLIGKAEVFGPFPHEEDARSYAAKNCGLHAWRIATLVAPDSEKSR